MNKIVFTKDSVPKKYFIPIYRANLHHQPTTEPKDSLSKTIFRTKMDSNLRKLGEAVVVFLLCRVGDDTEAEGFLRAIEEEKRLEGMVHVSHESVDEKLAVFQRVKDNRLYWSWVSFCPGGN